MGWWKADPEPSQPPVPSKPSPPPPSKPSHPSTDSAASCPVDPQTRSIWLQQARENQQASQLPPTHPPIPPATSAFTKSPAEECSSDRIDQSPSIAPSYEISNLSRPLSSDRVVSSIPRAFPGRENEREPTPANAETNASPHSSGNWVYPSEAQFFHAVLRKHSPESLIPPDPIPPTAVSGKSSSSHRSAEDNLALTIPTIIPIHNAVNERAWSLIKDWEDSFNPIAAPPRPNLRGTCTGPKLLSFRGLGSSSSSLSPKARLNSLLGYTTPFDRHDWTVQRCDGSQVEYVIDFYQGKDPGSGSVRKGQLNFYLDVRPKMNSVEGVRMNVERWIGWR